MSDDWKESESERAARLQRAFDEAAGGMGLRLEPASGKDARSVGVAFVFAALVPYDLAPPDDDSDDKDTIQQVIEGLEALSAAQYQNGGWKAFLNDPYVTVGSGGLGVIDQATLDQWLASPEFQEFQQEFPWKSPRDVKIKKVDITYIGQERAHATYRVTEAYANQQETVGNTAVTLIRRSDVGWRVIVVTKVSYDEA
ncbi:MAG: hypothetical protein ACJ75H_13055 [Thermoanaerobaculia bacterium]